MIKNDKQLGTPFVNYTDTKSGIEALSGVRVGATAVATDNPTAPFGVYINTGWHWYATGSVSGASLAFQDEGVPLGTPGTVNFVGSPVSVTVSGTVARVFITGSTSVTLGTASNQAASGTHTHNASAITAGTIDTARLGSGVANGNTILYGDQTWGDAGIRIDAPSDGSYYGRLNGAWSLISTAFASLLHTHSASAIVTGTMATARLGSGTASTGTFLRGDQTWATPDCVFLDEKILVADGTITFPSIPSGYRALKLIFALRSDRANVADRAGMQFNGDTGANYFANANAVPSGGAWVIVENLGDTDMDAFNIAGNNAPASSFGQGEINILYYNSTAFVKQAFGYGMVHRGAIGTTSLNFFWNGGGVWNSTAAITSIKLLPSNGGTNFKAGSMATLYGIK